MTYISVVLGGGAGALLRFLVSRAVNTLFSPALFIPGTLIVNGAGALCIGFLSSLFAKLPAGEALKPLFITGFLGGLTTFSAFSLETARFIEQGHIAAALVNVLLNNLLCILLVFAGMGLCRLWVR
jgi:CrcB protein